MTSAEHGERMKETQETTTPGSIPDDQTIQRDDDSPLPGSSGGYDALDDPSDHIRFPEDK